MRKWDSYFFYLLCILNCFPLIASSYFYTLDGPAHLYNAKLLSNWMASSGGIEMMLHEINPLPVPNWSGHAMLAILGKVLPMHLAEKLLLAGYLIAFPIALRELIYRISGAHSVMSYLGLPMAYSMVFLMGFYNFSLANLFMLISLGIYFGPVKSTGLSRTRLIPLAVTMLLLYFSHPVPFVMTLAIMGCHLLVKLVVSKQSFNSILPELKQVLTVSLLPCLLLLIYLMGHQSGGADSSAPQVNRLADLLQFGFLAIPNVSKVSPYNYLLLAVLLAALVSILITMQKRPAGDTKLIGLRWTMGAIAILSLLLYTLLPDAMAGGGYMASRLAWTFILFGIIWLSSFRLPRGVIYFSVLAILVCQVQRVAFLSRHLAKVEVIGLEMIDAATHLEQGDIVTVINQNNDWAMGHFSNYLGAEIGAIVLENYELDTGYFPLLRNSEAPAIVHPDALDSKENLISEHLFILGPIEEQESTLSTWTPIYLGQHCGLFRYAKP